jgi:hypothetical protein
MKVLTGCIVWHAKFNLNAWMKARFHVSLALKVFLNLKLNNVRVARLYLGQKSLSNAAVIVRLAIGQCLERRTQFLAQSDVHVSRRNSVPCVQHMCAQRTLP